MKKFLVVLFSLILCPNCCLADDFDSSGDLWDNFNTQLNPLAKNQKAVSDEEFDETIEKLKSKGKKPKKMKGESFQQSDETNYINNALSELPVICVAEALKISEDAILPVGHYQAVGVMSEGQPRIKLYQAHYLMADFPAVETEDDFDEPELNFIKLVEHNDTQVKIIFGSMDYNAYALIDIAKQDK